MFYGVAFWGIPWNGQIRLLLIMYDLNFIQKLIKAHAEYEQENECCGLIGLNKMQELQVVPCKNVCFDKKRYFEISPKAFIEKSEGLEVVSIYHSHLISSPRPSKFDKESSENWCLPFYIYSLKTESFYLHFPKSYKIPALENRTYMPDLRNCFRFVVDYYMTKGLASYFDLNFALTKKGQDYTKETMNMIKTFAKKNKFKKISKEDNIKKHDLILFEIDGFFSHFGVFIGDDQFWHHEGGFISRKNYLDSQHMERIHSIYRLN